MKKNFLILLLFVAGIMFSACNEQYEAANLAQQESVTFVDNYRAPAFPEPDDAELLDGTPQQNLKALFTAAGPEIINSLGSVVITDVQYQEIKTFTDELVASKTTEKDKYDAICRWVNTNVKYNNPQNNPENKYYNNDAYDVFKNRFAVCQGYSNLMVVMCMTQGIPAVVVNGYLVSYGMDLGHAWMYGCPDGTWYVSDPTNGTKSWPMKNTADYGYLKPTQADVDIFKDDCAVYNYYDGRLNVKAVSTEEPSFVVPYSVEGFVIGSFNPTVALPEGITEVYIGENIKTFGEAYDMRLKISNYGKNLQAVHVDEKNPALLSHKGIVYRKNGDESQLYYIPGGAEYLEFLPMEKVDKETVRDHQNVKVIYFPEGCKSFSPSAIEKCPKLEKVYIPEDASFPSNALYKCPKNVEVIRGSVPSSVKHVTM